jgi:hypothetical protein
MSTSPLSSQDIRAAAEVHGELGAEYGDAVVASFLDKVDREIAARVDARLAAERPVAQSLPARPAGPGTLAKGIAIGVAVGGSPLLATLYVQFKAGSGLTAIGWLITIWLIMTIATTANAVRIALPRRRQIRQVTAGRS